MIKKIISGALACIMALSSASCVAYAQAPEEKTNIFPTGTTSLAQMEIIKGYGNYVKTKARFDDITDPDYVRYTKAADYMMYDKLPKVADLQSERAQIARSEALADVYEYIARDPSIADKVVEMFNKVAGSSTDNPTLGVQVKVVESYSAVIESIARNPEPEFVEIIMNAKKKLSPKVTDFTSDVIQIARAEVFETLVENISRQPEFADLLVDNFEFLLGSSQPNPSNAVQGAYAKSVGMVIKSAARQPEALPLLTDAFDILAPKITAFTSDEVQIGRAQALADLTESAARQPEFVTTLIQCFETILGEKQPNPSNAVQGAYAKTISKLIEAVSRQPEVKQTIIDTYNKFAPEITNFASEEVQMARAYVSINLYKFIARYPENLQTLTDLFISYLGEKVDNPSTKVQGEYAKSLADLINEMARQPIIKNELKALYERVTPAITDLDSADVQLARAMTVSSIYRIAIMIPECLEESKQILFDELGSTVNNKSPEVQANYLLTDATLLDSIFRDFTQMDSMLSLRDQIMPVEINYNLEQVQVSRAKAINNMYDRIIIKLAEEPQGETIFDNLMGPVVPVNSFYVKFDSNGGNPVEDSIVFNNDLALQPNVTKDGYKLVNWLNGDNAYDFNTPVTENLVLTANWEKIPDAVEVKSPDTGAQDILWLMSAMALALGISFIKISKKQKIK